MPRPDIIYDAVVSFVAFNTDVAEIERAVDQVFQSRLDIHVVIVDNSVPALDLPAFDAARVTVIRTGENIGYGRAQNIAIRLGAGRCRYHLALNTDLRFDGTIIDRLAEFMDSRPTVGLVMPRVLYPDGRIQHLCRLLPTPLDLIGRRFFGRSGWAKRRDARYEFHDWGYDRIASFPFLSGCFMMMRRSVLDRVGGFDERYFLYGEDIDLSRRIHAVAETLFVPLVTVVHDYRTQSRRSTRIILYGIRSLTQYFSKWGWIWDRERRAMNRRCLEQLPR